nr:hypothetical protein [Tanacetum cinerariifolium]
HKFPNKVHKVVKALYGLHQAPRACVKTTSTPIKTQKPLVKDEEAANVDIHLYRSMIGSLMHLTASRPDILFVVCACLRFQVTSETPHLQAVKRIFRDAYEKKLIQVLKIHTDDNVAGLLTNAINVSSKTLASPKQMALGKDKSNLFMAGSLPKTKCFILKVYGAASATGAELVKRFFDEVKFVVNLDFIQCEDGNPARANVKQSLGRGSYTLSWKPCQGDSLNLPDHRYIVGVAASFQLS